MIKNGEFLVRSSSFPLQAAKALQIVEAGIGAVEVRGAIKKANLPDLKRFDNIYVIAFGKASAAMAEAIEKRLGKRIAAGAVVSIRKAKTKRIRSFVGSHPLPSKQNVVAAKKILALAEKAGKKDLVICLVSGGGSALLALPALPVCIRALQRINQLLLHARAPVNEINCVRKHISAIKGGLLMKAIYPAKMHALIISDAVGDDLQTIASGPTVADKTSFKQAIAVLKKHRLWKRVSADVRLRLSQGAKGKVAETPKPGNRIFRKAKNVILLNNLVALKAMKQKVKQLGFNAAIYSNTLEGEARKVGKTLVRIAAKKRRPLALLASGETTVKVTGDGKGGRNQEMVLGSLQELSRLEKVIFVSIGSDGIDGNSKAAGAIADSGTLQRARAKKLDWKKFLLRNDSNGFFKKMKGEVVTGSTETNVMDLQLLLAWH